MPITPRSTFSGVDYIEKRFQLLKELEGEEFAPYLDSKNLPTIGVGIEMRTNFNAVIQALGFGTSSTEVGYANQILAVINNTYATKEDLRAAIAPIMTMRAADPNVNVGTHPTFAFNDSTETRVLFDFVSQTNYEPDILAWERAKKIVPASTTTSSIADSSERLTLFSFAFNQIPGATALLGPKLALAFIDGNRAEAWYQIRYNSHKSPQLPGVAKRRIIESEVLGLYQSAGSATLAEALQAYSMLHKHRAVLDSEEAKWGKSFEGDRGTVLTTGTSTNPPQTGLELAIAVQSHISTLLDDGKIDSLSDNFMLARDTLIGWLNTSNITTGAASLNASQWNPLSVYFANDVMSVMSLDAARDDGRGAVGALPRLDHNLLVGKDEIDWLYGGTGDDVLIGRKGDDRLLGGDGEDTYVYNTGDGTDTVIDSDKAGRIVVDGVDLSNVVATLTPNAVGTDQTRWTGVLAGVQYTFSLNTGKVFAGGRLEIAKDGFGADDKLIVENFVPGDFHLALPTQMHLEIMPGMGPNPWNQSGYTAGNLSTPLFEGLTRIITLASDRPTDIGNVARISISEFAGAARLVVGDNVLEFAGDGTLEVALQPGQSSFSFALLVDGDFDSDTTFTLTGQIVDSAGQPVSSAADLNVEFDASSEGGLASPTTVSTTYTNAAGGLATLPGVTQDNREVIGLGGDDIIDMGVSSGQQTSEFWTGSDRIDAGNGDDVVYSQGGSDRVLGGAGRDYLRDNFLGNDTLEGGTGADYISASFGDDYVFGESSIGLDAAIVAGNTDSNIAETGDYLVGSDGLDTVIGSARRDLIAGGPDSDTLVGGAGDDFIVGDRNYFISDPPGDIFTWGTVGKYYFWDQHFSITQAGWPQRCNCLRLRVDR